MTKEVTQMVQRIRELLVDEEGATMVEYALLVGLISIVAIAVLVGDNSLGSKILAFFTKANTEMGKGVTP
jgi:pilus assembly protein Flp/PilA